MRSIRNTRRQCRWRICRIRRWRHSRASRKPGSGTCCWSSTQSPLSTRSVRFFSRGRFNTMICCVLATDTKDGLGKPLGKVCLSRRAAVVAVRAERPDLWASRRSWPSRGTTRSPGGPGDIASGHCIPRGDRADASASVTRFPNAVSDVSRTTRPRGRRPLRGCPVLRRDAWRPRRSSVRKGSATCFGPAR